uniref:RICTOR_V domain-containing protein n=1 Tax=Schistocephalus solidus TaxID=70667 RepID=A0A183SQU3_SCHSO
LLPQEHPCSQRLRSLIIFNQVSQSSRLTVDKISRVHAALEDFDKYTSILKICAPLHSPFLEQLACQSRTNDNTNGLCPRASPSGAFRSVSASPEASIHTTSGLSPVVVPLRRRYPPSASAKAATTVLKPLDDLLENVFVQSRVIIQSTPLHPASSKISYRRLTFAVSQKPYSWNWDVLATWARSLCAVNKPLSWKTPLRQASLERPYGPDATSSSARGSVYTVRSSDLSSFTVVNAGLCAWKISEGLSFLRRLFDFLTPDILLLSLPIHTIASTASSLSTPLPGNTQSTGSPLSPFYASLLHHKRSKNLTNDIVCIPNLAWTFQSWTEAWAAGILLGGLLQHLSLYPADSLPGQLLRQFLQSIHQCLLATLTFEEQMDVHAGVTAGTPVSNLHHLFQPVALKIFCSPLLLFAVGRFSSCEAGYELLTSMGLTEAIFQLLEQPTTSGVHRPLEVKINLNRQTLLLLKILLASSSFASNEGFGQRLLASAFRYGTESVRLFAVKFIRLILRMGLRADPEICISFLLRSLLDSSNPVVEEAIDVLEEACEVGGSNLQVINEYCNGSGDPAVLMMVTKKFGDHMTSGAAMGIEKCRLLNLPLLLLTPEAGLAGHRIFASLLSTPSVFHRFLEFPSIPPASNLVYWMLSAWRQFYNERYAVDLQHQFSALFQPRRFDGRSAKATEAPFPSCPVCGLQVKSILQSMGASTTKVSCLHRSGGRLPDVADSYESDLDLLMRPSNTTSTLKSLLACIGDEAEKMETLVVATHSLSVGSAPSYLFAEYDGPVVPMHLYSCLAMHDAGFDLLCDRGGLEELVNVLASYIAFCQSTAPSDQSSIPTNSSIQAAIWALSHVLVTQRGSNWSRATFVVGDLTRIFFLAKSMSVRGTAWLGLCFIASSQCGADLISRFGNPPKPEPPQPLPTWCVVRTRRFRHSSPLLSRKTLRLSPKLDHRNLTLLHNPKNFSALKPTFANLPSRKISAPLLSNEERSAVLYATSEQTQELFERRYVPMMCSDSHPPANSQPQYHQALLSSNAASSLPRPSSRWLTQFPSVTTTQSVLRPAVNIFKALSIKSRSFRSAGSKSSGLSSNQAPEQQQALGISKEEVVFTTTNITPIGDSIDEFLMSAHVATPHGMREVVSDGRLEDSQQYDWALTRVLNRSAISDAALGRLLKRKINADFDLPPSLQETIKAVQQRSSAQVPGFDAVLPKICKHGGPLPGDMESRTGPPGFQGYQNRSSLQGKRNRQLGGISLLNIAGNILARVPLNRFNSCLEQGLLAESHCGFRVHCGINVQRHALSPHLPQCFTLRPPPRYRSDFHHQLESQNITLHSVWPRNNAAMDVSPTDFPTPTADFYFRGIVLPSDLRLLSDVCLSALGNSQPSLQSSPVPPNEIELATQLKMLKSDERQQRLNGFCSRPSGGPPKKERTGSSTVPLKNGFTGLAEGDYTLLNSESPTAVVAIGSSDNIRTSTIGPGV